MMKKILIVFISVFLVHCTEDVEEEIYPCSSFRDVSYSGDIVPILTSNCYVCHAADKAPDFAKGNVLDEYEKLLIRVENGKLICAIKHLDCNPNMPFGRDKLSDCIINEIDTWVNEGALNN